MPLQTNKANMRTVLQFLVSTSVDYTSGTLVTAEKYMFPNGYEVISHYECQSWKITYRRQYELRKTGGHEWGQTNFIKFNTEEDHNKEIIRLMCVR